MREKYSASACCHTVSTAHKGCEKGGCIFTEMVKIILRILPNIELCGNLIIASDKLKSKKKAVLFRIAFKF